MALTLPPGVTQEQVDQIASNTGQTAAQVIATINSLTTDTFPASKVAASMLTPNTGGKKETPSVWLGSWNTPPGAPSSGFVGHGAVGPQPVKASKGTPQLVTLSQAEALIHKWSPQQTQQFIAAAQAAGYTINTPDELQSVWNGLVTQASNFYTAWGQGKKGAKPLSPWDILARNAKLFGQGGGAYNGPTTSTTQYSATDMENIGQNAYQAELGRDPTSAEISALPSSTTSTNTPGKHGSTTTDGANVQQEAIDAARRDPNYAEHQAATTYMDALTSAIASGM